MNPILFILALTVGNLAYQLLTDQSWTIALERSFFQAVAVGLYVLFGWE